MFKEKNKAAKKSSPLRKDRLHGRNRFCDSVWAISFSVLSCIGLLYIALFGWLSSRIGAVDPSDSTVQPVSVDGWSINSIAFELEEKGFVKSGIAFLARAQLTGRGGSMSAGTYYLSKNMDNDKIISILGKGAYDEEATTWVRIMEGDTVTDVADKLEEAKVIYDREAFLELCQSGKGFVGEEKYSYLSKNEDASFALEGFLAPDTYEFYFNSKPEDVISRLLETFDGRLSEELRAKCKKAGYSIADAVNMASIVEKEATQPDFAKVAAILNNRIKDDMYLQCDSTVRYVNDQGNLINLTDEQYDDQTPYNTYHHRGLPPSAICNPSLEAIEAILNPDKELVKQKYLYFCGTENADSGLVYAKTYEEHLENVKKYRGSWKKYDEAVKNQ